MSQRLRRASRVRHLLETWDGCRRNGDHPLAAPTGSAKVHTIAERQRRSTVHRDLLQLSARQKPQPLTVGREEGVDGSFRAGDGPSLLAIHRPQIKLLDTALPGHIREATSVG